MNPLRWAGDRQFLRSAWRDYTRTERAGKLVPDSSPTSALRTVPAAAEQQGSADRTTPRVDSPNRSRRQQNQDCRDNDNRRPGEILRPEVLDERDHPKTLQPYHDATGAGRHARRDRGQSVQYMPV